MFDRNDTKAIKGIAVVMMLLHHIAAFPARYPVGFGNFSSLWKGFVEKGYLTIMATNVRICVAVFFFLGGYGMYMRWSKGKYSLFDSAVALYKKYWKVFAVFAPIALIFFRRSGEGINALTTRYSLPDAKSYISMIIANFFALSESMNGEWWFIAAYLGTMVMGLVYCVALKKNKSFAVELFIIFLIDILFRNIFPILPAIPKLDTLNTNFFYTHLFKLPYTACTFFMGITMAKFDGIARVKNAVARLPYPSLVGFFGVFVLLWARSFVMGDALDTIYSAAFVIFASLFFDGIKPVKKVFGILGVHSTNIWLIHTFYCYYFLEATKLVYLTHNVWVDLAILLSMSLLSSVLIELLYDKLGTVYKKITAKNKV